MSRPSALHERIAAALDWPMKGVQSFSLPTLREMVRDKNPKLAALISEEIAGGHHIYEVEEP